MDSPVFALISDPHITITLWFKPSIDGNGKLEFTLDTETKIDTGLEGDLLVATIIFLFIGGLGLFIGFATLPTLGL